MARLDGSVRLGMMVEIRQGMDPNLQLLNTRDSQLMTSTYTLFALQAWASQLLKSREISSLD